MCAVGAFVCRTCLSDLKVVKGLENNGESGATDSRDQRSSVGQRRDET